MKAILIGIAVLAGAGGAWAQAKSASDGGIYVCIDASGKKTIYDRPTVCPLQQERRPDGSLKRIVPPAMSDEDKAEDEARKREQDAKDQEERVNVRRDQNLIHRFPDKAAHDKARADAINVVYNAMRITEARIALLKAERVPIDNEVEFYPDKSKLPSKVKLALDANNAALDAQRQLLLSQQPELDRINKNYDEELQRLRVLWDKRDKMLKAAAQP